MGPPPRRSRPPPASWPSSPRDGPNSPQVAPSSPQFAPSSPRDGPNSPQVAPSSRKSRPPPARWALLPARWALGRARWALGRASRGLVPGAGRSGRRRESGRRCECAGIDLGAKVRCRRSWSPQVVPGPDLLPQLRRLRDEDDGMSTVECAIGTIAAADRCEPSATVRESAITCCSDRSTLPDGCESYAVMGRTAPVYSSDGSPRRGRSPRRTRRIQEVLLAARSVRVVSQGPRDRTRVLVARQLAGMITTGGVTARGRGPEPTRPARSFRDPSDRPTQGEQLDLATIDPSVRSR
jgi:hypothetical protein